MLSYIVRQAKHGRISDAARRVEIFKLGASEVFLFLKILRLDFSRKSRSTNQNNFPIIKFEIRSLNINIYTAS